mmetsp:Transcript_31140/g.69220  ORF Transcript_31140/g.69220 Transcript_31140/m.69220 type:complete len:674 (+) Transcript_31140:208-2229(+)
MNHGNNDSSEPTIQQRNLGLAEDKDVGTGMREELGIVHKLTSLADLARERSRDLQTADAASCDSENGDSNSETSADEDEGHTSPFQVAVVTSSTGHDAAGTELVGPAGPSTAHSSAQVLSVQSEGPGTSGVREDDVDQQQLEQMHHATSSLSLVESDPDLQQLEAVASSLPQAPAAASNLRRQSTLSGVLEDDTVESWLHHPKHFFVLSSSGKPIYSYHGDENSLAGLMALITALVSVVEDQGDTVQHIVSGPTLIVFLCKGPVYLVATSNLGEPIVTLQRQLELLYKQIILVVTTGLERIMLRNAAYDARELLQGVGGILSALIRRMRLDPAYLLAAVQPLPLPAGDRSLAAHCLSEAMKFCGALYGLLMVGDHVVVWDRAKQQPPMDPWDLLLLSNFITCNRAYRYGHGEAFCPVCLPSYNPGAFLHAYIDYLDTKAGVYLVLLAGSSDTFHQLSAARVQLQQQLSDFGVLPRLVQLLLRGGAGGDPMAGGWAAERAAAASAAAAARLVSGQDGGASDAQSAGPARSTGLGVLSGAGAAGRLYIESLPKPMGGRFGTTPLWHFLVRMPNKRQMFSAAPGELFTPLPAQQQLACSYAKLQSIIQDCPDITRPNRIVWIATEQYNMLACVDAECELYLTFDPLTDETTASKMSEGLRRHLLDRTVQMDLLLPA